MVSGGELGATVRGAITTGVANVAGADASVEVAGAAVEVAGGVAVVVVEVGAGGTAAVEVGVADVCVV
jgi:hypothetical protein